MEKEVFQPKGVVKSGGASSFGAAGLPENPDETVVPTGDNQLLVGVPNTGKVNRRPNIFLLGQLRPALIPVSCRVNGLPAESMAWRMPTALAGIHPPAYPPSECLVFCLPIRSSRWFNHPGCGF